MGQFSQCSQFGGFSVENYIFEIVSEFSNFAILIWNRNKIVGSLPKIHWYGTNGLEDIDLLYFEIIISSKFCDFFKKSLISR